MRYGVKYRSDKAELHRFRDLVGCVNDGLFYGHKPHSLLCIQCDAIPLGNTGLHFVILWFEDYKSKPNYFDFTELDDAIHPEDY